MGDSRRRYVRSQGAAPLSLHNDSLPDFPLLILLIAARKFYTPRSGMQNGVAWPLLAWVAPCSRIKPSIRPSVHPSIHLAVFYIAIFIMNSQSKSRKRLGRTGRRWTRTTTTFTSLAPNSVDVQNFRQLRNVRWWFLCP